MALLFAPNFSEDSYLFFSKCQTNTNQPSRTMQRLLTSSSSNVRGLCSKASPLTLKSVKNMSCLSAETAFHSGNVTDNKINLEQKHSLFLEYKLL